MKIDESAIIRAGFEFRTRMIEKADRFEGHAPLWYGWVIMEAFKAGVAYARNATPAPSSSDTGAT